MTMSHGQFAPSTDGKDNPYCMTSKCCYCSVVARQFIQLQIIKKKKSISTYNLSHINNEPMAKCWTRSSAVCVQICKKMIIQHLPWGMHWTVSQQPGACHAQTIWGARVENQKRALFTITKGGGTLVGQSQEDICIIYIIIIILYYL